jgi:creatinine amidohydrolase
MKRVTLTVCVLLAAAVPAVAQTAPQTPPAGRAAGAPPSPPPASYFSKSAPPDLVEFEMMTWPEVYRAIHDQGKTTALVYTGGTEQRGPQNVNGGHTLMAKATVKAIALKLGNAIALPVLPYSPNGASGALPGTIGLTNELLGAMLEQIAEQAIITGFKNVILMGDHGGGQPRVYAEVAKKLEDKYATKAQAEGHAQDIHVYFCDEVYAKAQGDFEKYLQSQNLPTSSHAGIQDTSEMMYLQGSTNDYTRVDLLPVAFGGRGQQPADPNAPRPVSSGVSGDGRQSNVTLGKMAFDNKVTYAVAQIQRLLAGSKSPDR